MTKKKAKSNPKTITKPKLQPLGDRVLVKPFTAEELEGLTAMSAHAGQTGKKGGFGIILPDAITKEKSAQGKVLAVGEGKWQDGKLVPMRLKVGDRVVFSKYSYDEVEHDGEELYLLKEDNIFAIIK